MRLLFVCIVIVTLGMGCKKQSSCNTSNLQITANSPVIAGWPLQLSAFESIEYLYEWTGPNGFNRSYEVFSTAANEQTIVQTELADAGVYTLKLRNREGCIEYQGSVNVVILPQVAAPCQVPDNSSETNLTGIGGVEYFDTTLRMSEYSYDVTSYGQGQALAIRFSKLPKPGIYTASSTTVATGDLTVGIFVGAGLFDFIMELGNKVYVTRENGQLYVSFCEAKFINPFSAAPLYISARIKLWG